jgi:hypothetical protein
LNRTITEKKSKVMQCPRILALFQKRVDGDDALLHLARLRFSQAGLGTEFYAETPEELEYLLQFKPLPETPAVVHLGRGLNVLDRGGRATVADFAETAGGRLFGLVVHDQVEIATQFDDYTEALRELDSLFQGKNSAYLFVEYAAGLDTEVFINLFRRIRGLKNISACIDTGHVGIWKARGIFSQIHPDMDVCDIRTDHPGLKELIKDISSSVDAALPETLRVIRELGALGKPLHFHLHDGHPFSASSPFGVSDHMSFLETVPLPFEFRGRMSIELMYGLSGLSSIVSESLESLPAEKISFSLEIHPGNGRIPLDDASYFFDHWRDRTNAERMNFWLTVLSQNKRLIEETCRQYYGQMKRN